MKSLDQIRQENDQLKESAQKIPVHPDWDQIQYHFQFNIREYSQACKDMNLTDSIVELIRVITHIKEQNSEAAKVIVQIPEKKDLLPHFKSNVSVAIAYVFVSVSLIYEKGNQAQNCN